MKIQWIPGLTCALFFGTPALAQVDHSFPLDVVSTDPTIDSVTVKPDYAEINQLMGQRNVTMRDVYLPGGQMLDLELRRLNVDRLKYGFQVDGEERTDLLDGLNLSVWVGTVPGQPNSDVVLSFSNAGSRGWIQSHQGLFHLMPKADERGDWNNSSSLWMTEESLVELNGPRNTFCDSIEVDRGEGGLVTPPSGEFDQAQYESNRQLIGGSCSARECTMAIETDYHLYDDTFNGNLGAATAYVTSLTSAASDRYEQQFNTVLTFPYVQFHTQSNDGWNNNDGNEPDIIAMLYEFQGAWVGNIPSDARLAHFLSGANLGGGVAYVNVLCNDEANFGVSGNINGNLSFPVSVGPQNWDFMVFCHEVGHNFASPHTHSYCPPIDECAPQLQDGSYLGQCQDEQACINNGTLMSYCHLCPGGISNFTLFFHPTVINLVIPATDACLPLFSGIAPTGQLPTVLSTENPTQASIDLEGDISGTVVLNYRYNSGAYSQILMSNTSGNTYVADLPVADCSDNPEMYVSFNSNSCGPGTYPEGGASAPWVGAVGELMLTYSDNFQTNQGWTTSNAGASSGDWQRGVPVNDNGWDHDPNSDGDGSGACYLTQNETGNTDVDGGSVTLFSPSIDMSGSNVVVNYEYFLKLTNQDGTDELLVEANNNGGSGSWSTIAVHNTNGDLSWRSHQINMAATGLTLTNDMVLRFTANDGDPQSIVEAGLDGFSVSAVACDSGPSDPVVYCDPGNANSFSPLGASLAHVSGLPGGMMTFDISGVPNTPGILFYGDGQADQPFGCGRRCVIGSIVRSNVYFPGTNNFQAQLDTTGSTTNPFNIQYWFRDPSNVLQCGFEFNTTNAIGF